MDLAEVFVIEGFPHLTYVEPLNYYEILIDVKSKKKPVIIEGQTGTGKTSTILKILSDIKEEIHFEYLSARNIDETTKINQLINSNFEEGGNFVIDDFHRLVDHLKLRLSNIAKLAADNVANPKYPKLVIIGINQTGRELLKLSPDIAKRFGVHKIQPATEENVKTIIEMGEKLLNIKFLRHKPIYSESKGDYWLTQHICQTICTQNGVINTQEETKQIKLNIKEARRKIIGRLEYIYNDIVKEFCRGKRFRPSNDAYIKFLESVSKMDDFPIDLNELIGNVDDHHRIAISSIKGHRLDVLIKEKIDLRNNFYYSKDTKLFNIEDPALQYYIKHIDWNKLYKECGFKKNNGSYKYDIAISFAGEKRELAEEIADQLQRSDYEVFYDRLYEDNYLGMSLSDEFERIFTSESKFVVCLLDKNHKKKIWPTFERDCFLEKVQTNEVIPIFLDDTKFPGIPNDIACIRYEEKQEDKKRSERVQREIIERIISKVQ